MKSVNLKTESFAKLKVVSLITIIALITGFSFSACNDESSDITNNYNLTAETGSLTIFKENNIYLNFEKGEYYICAYGEDAGKNPLIAAGAITGNNITCVPAGIDYTVLNVWAVKDGKFIPYTGSGIAFLYVFIINQETITYDQIKTLGLGSSNNIEWVEETGYSMPSFTSGTGYGIFAIEFPY